MDETELLAELKKAKKQYREAKKNHANHRLKFLETLVPKDRDRLKKTEEQRKLGRIAKMVTGKLESKSVTRLIHNGGESTVRTEIEEILRSVNKEKIRASDNTPFMQELLSAAFGFLNDTPATDEVLMGTYVPPPGTDAYSRILLQMLKFPDAVFKGNIPFRPCTHISTEDHIAGWKRAKEKTSAGISGLHFGMFKAHIQRWKLAAMDASMRSVAYTTGFSYKRWKKGIDVQLLKRKKDFRAHRLRTILLTEADWNMNNKTLGRDAMRSAERLNALARDNYGGRKDLRAIEVGLNVLLASNSILARRGRAVIMSNDAKGCYDRIAHIVVNIALRRLGIPKPALSSMISTIQGMTHFIRTAFGDSEEGYKIEDDEHPPAGILQGNGAGPAGWSAISGPLIEAMKQAGFGYNVWTVIRQRAIAITCFAFVDDTTLIHTPSDPNMSTADFLVQAQEALDLWEGLLQSTGGALAPEKSYWYLLDVRKRNNKWQFVRSRFCPGELYVANRTYRIKRQETSEANEGIGVQFRPDSGMAQELAYLKTKIVKWCDAIRTKKVQKHEAWYCLNSTISKTLEYPLAATMFTEDQCIELVKPLFKVILRKCGIQRKLPRKLLHGPLKAQGMGVKAIYVLQLIAHLQVILRHSDRDTPTNDLLDDNMELVQLHVGSEIPFWDLPYDQYSCLAPDGWVKHTWKCLSETPLSLKGPNITKPKERMFDQHIMDSFIAIGTPEEYLPDINECRLHLGVTTLSNITTACGTYITQQAWDGKQSYDRKEQHWIRTRNPSQSQWDRWRQALRDTFLSAHSTNRRLNKTLGIWTEEKDASWIWWKHHTTDTLYQQQDNEWHQWSRAPIHRYNKYMNPIPVQANDVPQVLHRASVHVPHRRRYITVLSTGMSTYTNDDVPASPSIQQSIQNLPMGLQWTIDRIKTTDNGNTIATAIRNNNAVAVSDGSLKHNKGTAAFVIEGSTSVNRISGVNRVPNPVNEGDSHRCELAGIIAILMVLEILCKRNHVTKGSITIACDNKHAINAMDAEYTPDPSHLNFDLVKIVWRTIKTLPITIKGVHVKGHQDDTTDVSQLSREAILNIEMDHMAKAYWEFCHNSQAFDTTTCIQMEREGWQIWHGNKKLNRPTTNCLYDIIYTPKTLDWWVRHGFTTEEKQAEINHEITAEFMKTIPANRRRWVTKHASDNCGVGTTLLAWKYQTNATCPRCQHSQENTKHILQCTGHDANAVWDQGIKELNKYMDNQDTDQNIQNAIVQGLQCWQQALPIDATDYPLDIQEALTIQTNIGWKSLMEGLAAKQWQKLQALYYTRCNLQKSSKKWIIGLLQKCNHLAFSLWEHRNHIKHHVTKKRYHDGIDALNTEIIRQFMQSTPGLFPKDQRRYFKHNLITVLRKNFSYKKSWLANILSARKHHLRKQTNNQTRDDTSKDASNIIRWMRSGRLT